MNTAIRAAGTPVDVLMVDDDAATRRYFQLALRQLQVSVHTCGGLDEALVQLAQHTPRFVVSDLNLQGQSSQPLAAFVAAMPSTQRPAFVLMSGHIEPQVEDSFRQLGVRNFWTKPVSLEQLRSLVPGASSSVASELPSPALATAEPQARVTHVQHEHSPAVDRFFQGNERMFLRFRDQTLAALPGDVQAAQAAWTNADANALGALMHNLKSVLQMIGQPREAALALGIEDTLQYGELTAVETQWAELRERLLQACAGGRAND